MTQATTDPAAIAARHAQTIGDGPRIIAVDGDSMDQQAIDLIIKVRAGAGVHTMDEVPEYMRIVVKHPELFERQMEMGAMLYNGRLPARDRELAVLRVGWLCRAPYEFGQHVIIAKRIGMSDADIENAIEGSTASVWNEHDAAILRGVEELIDDKCISDATWETLAKSWDEAQMIEFPVMVGQYVAVAYLQNTMRVPLESGNKGLKHR